MELTWLNTCMFPKPWLSKSLLANRRDNNFRENHLKCRKTFRANYLTACITSSSRYGRAPFHFVPFTVPVLLLSAARHWQQQQWRQPPDDGATFGKQPASQPGTRARESTSIVIAKKQRNSSPPQSKYIKYTSSCRRLWDSGQATKYRFEIEQIAHSG